jgi:nucleoside-diphosphate-sugar epimerase
VNVLITGGAGFIGSHLADVLLERQFNVVTVDNLSRGARHNFEHNLGNPRFVFHELDVRDLAGLLEIGRGCDAVVHLAAEKIPRYGTALSTLTTNLDGGRAALELARANEAKFILASTSDVYGKNPALPFREDSDIVLGPSTSRRWAYALTKLCDEHFAYAYQDEYGISVTILRFFGSYGERQYLDWWGGPQGVFLQAIARREPLEIHGDGLQTRCFIHVADLVEATARAIERDNLDGQILNIGTDEEVTIVGLAQLMHRLSGISGELKIQYIPYESFTTDYEDVRRRAPEMTKMSTMLEFMPRISLEDGLRRLWDWYRSRASS